ncbi:FadR family transcriptional regulator [Metallumcola ferriviriculae]|uniref:FadR family transcriptional regulator n=1 Tax=Metallumcola ferriviriculae TaxID=3039180 RepID=A0AAU0ULD6_9FIRM|nr:FadR family transcriptional regulator [Desulfitibacteraceae bacterium MK1]
MEKVNVKRTNLPDLIIKHFEEMLVSGRLKPGDKLPTEHELMELFSVGRTTIREVLKSLSVLGVIKRTSQGTFVEDTSKMFLSPVGREIMMQQNNFEKIYEARGMLEAGLAGLAAERASDQELVELETVLMGMKSQIEGDNQAFIQSDIAFHQQLAKLAANEVLYNIFISVREMVIEAQTKVVGIPGIKEEAFKQHLAIYEAVKKRDRPKAETVMLAHVNNIKQYVSEA